MRNSEFRRAAGRLAAAGALVCASFVSLAAHANNIIVLNSGDATLSLIDSQTHQVMGTVPTGKEPHHLFPTPDSRSLIVANSVSNNLLFVDPQTGKPQLLVENVEDPYQLGFSPDRKWFVTTALRLDRLDIYHYAGGAVFTVAKRLPLSAMPSHLAFTRDSRTVFVSLQSSGEIAAVDLPSQQVLWKMPVGSAPAGLWLTPGDKYLLVGMTGADYVAVVDWRNQKIVKQIAVGRAAHNFRSLADGRHVLVSSRVSNTISIVDEVALEKTGEIGDLLPGPDDMELSADKRYLWVTFRFAKQVGVIDMHTKKLIKTIPVGRSPHGIYFYDRAPVMAPNGA
ncbi:beta-propeller fold lactonase family protein [Paraburkholderia sp.]|uniref:YVTN family beta-propeller repeat protein n=1 Tax=Paraburkholderia sp. TaxID=1926495 RepID=UPI0025CC759B|nr:beta-propeller fold lactonase family protein [Paraburkholderia sp.]